MRGIFVKIYLAFLFTSLVAVVMTLLLASYYREWSNESVNLIAPTGGYISAAELILQRGGEPLLIEWLLTFERHPSVNAYVFDSSGISLLAGVPEVVRNYALSSESYDALINPLGRSEIIVKAPISSYDGRFYLLVVEFIHPLSVFNLPEYLAWGFAASLALFALLGFLLSGYFTQPLRRMQRSVRAMGLGDWSVRIPAYLQRRGDEFGELSREFNQMAGKLERSLQDQKQLVRDVSHELRSPLARLRVALELARLDSLAEQQEFLDRIELETQRLDELIGDLLGMARLEVEQDKRLWQTVDSEQLLRDIIADARFERPDGDIRLYAQAQHCELFADPTLLAAALENIIRNALLHTRPGTSVDIHLQNRQNCLHINIRDHGPGVADAQLADLLRPFVRHEDARQRSTESLQQGHRGYGLGLAIADKVVRAHEGSLTLSNHPQGGLQADICLPLTN
ncbi:ATP-binding protein [Bacterioplanoides pacificum]|uniref:histidine kinase n=1 Tax=Bacterioplanoides pacificum TaxID=1171596 RepID=A0ABV7VWR0_9GAMM